MKSRSTISILVLWAIAGATALSQPHDRDTDRDSRSVASNELRERMRTWWTSSIKPVLLAWKAELDSSMTSGDLAILNDLRAGAAQARRDVREAESAVRTAWKEEDFDALKLARRRLTEARVKQLDILDLLTPLAIEYRETLKTIGEKARPFADRWKEEGRKMFEELKAEYGADVRPGEWRRLVRRSLAGRLIDPGIMRDLRVIRFMLWSGETWKDVRPEQQPGLQ